ncbi:MAG: hypothetical protein HQM02_00815 [Magnetococcales bacterium]|nr:hypothetical protein [Magnetococcales bacterium]
MKRLALLLNLSCVALLSYELAEVTWKVTREETVPVEEAMGQLPPAPPVQGEAVLTPDRFIGLFGAVDTPLKSAPEAAPATQLNLQLLGILFVDNNPANARALIGTPEARERSYGVGESIGKAVIRAIQADQVILEHNGRQEALRLPKKELSLSQGEGVPQKVQMSPDAKALLGALWNTLQERPESLLEQVRIEPAHVRGKFAGVQLFPGKDPTFLEKFGLRGGDRITWINGVELTDPLKGMTVLGTLGSASALQLRVSRGEETLFFELQRNP